MFMRRILLTVSSLGAICLVAGSLTTAADTKVEQELMQLERDWSAAVLKHDTATIDRILADDYVGIDGRGIITTKAQEIEEAKAPNAAASPPPFLVLDETISDMKVRAYGNVAVVNGRVIEKIRGKRKGKRDSVSAHHCVGKARRPMAMCFLSRKPHPRTKKRMKTLQGGQAPYELGTLRKLLQQRLPARPGIVARFLVRFARVGRFAFAHETVAGAFVNHRLIFFAGGFH